MKLISSKKIAFKAHLSVWAIPGEGMVVLAKDGTTAFHGSLYESLAGLIDGSRSADEIADALEVSENLARTYFALENLEKAGFLTYSESQGSERSGPFWQSLGIEPMDVERALRTRRVAVRAAGSIALDGMFQALAEAGLDIAQSATDADLLIVVAEHYLHPELAEINELQIATSQPWLILQCDGPQFLVGPLFNGHDGCWECLRQRVERNFPVHRFVAEKLGLRSFPNLSRGYTYNARASAYSLAAVVALKWLSGPSEKKLNDIVSFEWSNFTTDHHPFWKNPSCTACAKPEPPEVRPLTLASCKISYSNDGGFRSVSPTETLARYAHLVSPISGIVHTLSPAAHSNDTIKVYMAGANSAMPLANLANLRKGLRSWSSGKGLSDPQAKASALCESIERYSGELDHSDVRVKRAFRDWEKGLAYRPNEVMLYSDAQYRDRHATNSLRSLFNRVPEPLDEAEEIDWTPVWSLSDERYFYLPTQLLYFRAPATAGNETYYSIACSNGSASGNTMEEAILHGLFELIERDATAIWWYNRISRPSVNIESFCEPRLVELLEYYKNSLSREAWALDLTHDIGIPVFVAVSRSINASSERLLFGFGCHLDARVALQRAFTEMNQLLGIAAMDANAATSLEDGDTLRWLDQASLARDDYLAPSRLLKQKYLHDFPQACSQDILEDIQNCRSLIEAQGMTMLVLNQTRADVGMPVAKVVVPGLRHFWARFAPGRLYDIPVKLGWLEQPRTEAELNPIAMFI